jgi:hypothetical protein
MTRSTWMHPTRVLRAEPCLLERQLTTDDATRYVSVERRAHSQTIKRSRGKRNRTEVLNSTSTIGGCSMHDAF